MRINSERTHQLLHSETRMDMQRRRGSTRNFLPLRSKATKIQKRFSSPREVTLTKTGKSQHNMVAPKKFQHRKQISS